MRLYLVGVFVSVMTLCGASASMAQRESTDEPGAAINGLRLEDLTDRIERLTMEVSALRDEVGALKSEVLARVGAWEPFGRDLKTVVEDRVEYEYALVRNGSFQPLTASSWNSGWRVMTSPYMTGDSARFRLAEVCGSGAHETRGTTMESIICTIFFEGDGVVATGGNGLKPSGADTGEGLIYRRAEMRDEPRQVG